MRWRQYCKNDDDDGDDRGVKDDVGVYDDGGVDDLI